MLLKQRDAKASTTTTRRLEIVHRLKHPKLKSDMSAFQAANPGASYRDFCSWYGDPSNPLQDFSTAQSQDLRLGLKSMEGAPASVEAAEGKRAIQLTQKFWRDTWEEACPTPAADQNPLFDAMNTSEITLDYLETLHPASLVCQILAINLGSAYYTLSSSTGDAKNVDVVRRSLRRLRDHTDVALQLLALDATTGTGAFSKSSEGDFFVASSETITACERVCNAIGETELLLSRAKSMLEKLPGQHDLVQKILTSAPGIRVKLASRDCRLRILREVALQQSDDEDHNPRIPPSPSIREYVIRNTDDSLPSQLWVRYGELQEGQPRSLAIAQTKYTRH